MLRSGIGLILLFIALVFLQVSLFDKIHIFGYATPMLSIYFIIKMPGQTNQNQVLLVSAFLGLCIDIFTGILGINMLACVVTAFNRPFFLKLFAPKDTHGAYTPSFFSFGNVMFIQFAVWMTLLHHILVFAIESFSLFDPLGLFIRIVSSVTLTVLLIAACESFHFDFGK
ncbi:MAG: rod shape-determining protein MreD [Candidatus Symbiothrix sp.]|jgi:rod shape-determining protein MreD|nr:rod shape-determining protein MreD [Candidatus Symbiothrix sp.]